MTRHQRLQRTMRNPGRQQHRARKRTRHQRVLDIRWPGDPIREQAYKADLLPASALRSIWRQR